MKIAITGATGFVGGELVKYFSAQGHEVLKLQRQSVKHSDERFFDMRSADSIPPLQGIDALIHTAFLRYDTVQIPDASDINIRTTLALEQACQRARVRFVFLSTMSAHSQAISHYGKHKYDIEQQLNLSKSIVFKLGLVIGEKGLFNTIKTTIQKTNFIPLVGSGVQPIQTVAVSDVCKAIDIVLQKQLTGIYLIGTERVYTIRDLYATVAAGLGKKPTFVSLPYWLLSLAFKTIELLHIPFNLSNENLLGLKQLKAFDTKEDIETIGISLIDMQESVHQLLAKK